MKDYYSQLVEDIRERLLWNYEPSDYNESLFLLKNATPDNIKLALMTIFNNFSDQNASVKSRINELKHNLPAFSILKDQVWYTSKLSALLKPEITQSTVYFKFLFDLGKKLDNEFQYFNERLSKFSWTILHFWSNFIQANCLILWFLC